MNLAKILQELKQERDQLDEAILSLERLAASSGPRRGRPPAWLKVHKNRGPAANSKEPAATKSMGGS